MLPLSAISASLAPGMLAFGFCLILALFRPERPAVRAAVFAAVVLLGWRYMAWRFSETLADPGWSVDYGVSLAFALLEGGTILSGGIAFMILSRTLDRSPEADRNEGWWGSAPAPRVDILIASYNEEAAILERTIIGAAAVSHERCRVWVLDDGRREWLREMCERLGARHLTRADNKHAKAGNINAAFAVLRALPEPPDFIAVLDADFVPHTDFVTRAIALFHDPAVGLVQTPQHFFNPDPIQHNLGIGSAYPDEQRFFFDHIQKSRDAWSISFCCGTSSMMRWKAMEAIEGFPTDSVTEDFLVTLRLREEGWKTVYLAEALTEGLAPEGLGEYITQRGRWCLGLMQIVRGPMGPLSRNRLRPIDRIGLFDAFLYWATTYPFRLACLFVPLLYWFFGITAVNAPVSSILEYFLPFYLASLGALNWVSGGLVLPILNDVSQVLGSFEITKAVVIGIAKPKGHKFKVTAKGGNRDRVVVQWGLIRPLGATFLVTVAGLFFSDATDIVFERDAGDGKWIILFWTLYNLVVLAVSISVCIEMPRSSTAPRIEPERVAVRHGDQSCGAWVMRLTTEDAWIKGGPPVAAGDDAWLGITGIGEIRGRVSRTERGGFSLALQPDARQRTDILAKIHTRRGQHSVMKTDMGKLVEGILRRITR